MTRVVPFPLYRVFPFLIAALALATLASVLAVQPALADETFEVNSVADAPDDNPGDGNCETAAGECTLRAAIQESNALSDGVESFFILVYNPGVYVLTDQLAVSGQNIFIYGTGNANDVVIDGNNITRVFDVSPAASVSMFWMTLRGGTNVPSEFIPAHSHGAAIHNHGEVTIANVTILDSVIESTTPGVVSCATHCGAALYNAGTATMDQVTFANNRNEFADTAAQGAAIYNASTLTLRNATLADNTTAGGGGSAIYSVNNADLTHVTIANNATVGGAAVVNDGGTFNLTATIVANNVGGNCSGTFTDNGANFSFPDASCPGQNVDPGLSPAGLADNGGDTQTINLVPDAAAIDAYAACTLSIDQRVVPRPQPAGGDCDSGAVEFINTAQGCMYAGSLSRIGDLEGNTIPTLSCGRGEPVVLIDGDDYFACMYAGSLSQFGTTEPASCGRGEVYGFAAGTSYFACLYAGSLSQFGTNALVNCGRGVQIGLAGAP